MDAFSRTGWWERRHADHGGKYPQADKRESVRIGLTMGWLFFIICAVSVYLLYNIGQPVLWVLALINAIASLWSYGIMHNYAVEESAAKIKRLQENLSLEGRLDEERQAEIDKIKLAKNLQAVPGWLTTMNLLTFVIGFGLLGYGIWLML